MHILFHEKLQRHKYGSLFHTKPSLNSIRDTTVHTPYSRPLDAKGKDIERTDSLETPPLKTYERDARMEMSGTGMLRRKLPAGTVSQLRHTFAKSKGNL